MFRRILASALAAAAVVATFAVLAFSQRPPTPVTAGSQKVIVTRTAGGALVPIVPGTGTVHATTSSSGVASNAVANGSPSQSMVVYVKTPAGKFVPIGSQPTTTPAAITRSS